MEGCSLRVAHAGHAQIDNHRCAWCALALVNYIKDLELRRSLIKADPSLTRACALVAVVVGTKHKINLVRVQDFFECYSTAKSLC